MESEQQVFYITICSMACTLIVVFLKYGYKSKCSEVDVGCIKIKRNVESEIKYDLEHPVDESQEMEAIQK
jgi:hypothetical protein